MKNRTNKSRDIKGTNFFINNDGYAVENRRNKNKGYSVECSMEIILRELIRGFGVFAVLSCFGGILAAKAFNWLSGNY